MDFLQLHARAHAAGVAAPRMGSYAIIVPQPNSNFTRWLKRQGFQPIHDTGYALAYVGALQAAGELATVIRQRKPPLGHDGNNNECPMNADPRNECCACIAPWVDRQYRLSENPTTTQPPEEKRA